MREAGARAGWLSLCLLPLSLALGRFWPAYIAHADGVDYQYRSFSLYPSDALVLLTCVGWFAWRWRSRPRSRLPRGSGFVLLALALLATAASASTAAAYDRRLALGVTAQLVVLIAFFVAAAELIAAFPRRSLLLGVAAAVVGQSLLAGWQAVAQTTAPAGMLFNGWAGELTSHDQGASVVMLPIVGRWLRSYGSFPHPNILGGFLALSLAVLVLQIDPRRHRLHVVALAMGFAALLLTFSRAAWLAVLLGAPTIVFATPGGWATLLKARRHLALAVAGSALGLVVLIRVASLGSLVEQNSIQTRAFYNSVAWDVIGRGAPVGAGNLVVAQQHLLGASEAGNQPAHDVLVIALAELGPIGLVAWLSILGSLLVAAWLRRAEPHDRVGPLVAVAVLTPLLLLDHYLWTQPAGRVLVVWTLTVLMSSRAERDMTTTSVDRLDLAGSESRERPPSPADEEAQGVTALRIGGEEAND